MKAILFVTMALKGTFGATALSGFSVPVEDMDTCKIVRARYLDTSGLSVELAPGDYTDNLVVTGRGIRVEGTCVSTEKEPSK